MGGFPSAAPFEVADDMNPAAESWDGGLQRDWLGAALAQLPDAGRALSLVPRTGLAGAWQALRITSFQAA
jgi:hypothetical protein